MFSDEAEAVRWLEELRWPNGPFCPKCGSFNVQAGIRHKTMTHRCRDCANRPMFSLRMGTIMEGTKLPYRVWVVGMKDRASNEVRAKVVQRTDAETLQGFIVEHVDAFATVYTDDATAYASLPFEHDTVKHSVSEYVKGQAHTNGIESFWSMLKRGYQGTYHKMSPKHLDRYVAEFARRHNVRDADTIEQMQAMVEGMALKRLKHSDLIADNGLDTGAPARCRRSRWCNRRSRRGRPPRGT